MEKCSALQNYNQYTLTVQLKTMNELGDRLIQSAELFQSERGYINSALNNPEPSQNDFLERIKTLDLKGNVFLSSALADLPQSFKNKNEAALKRLEKSTNDFKRFQRESINAISLPDSKRPAHLKILWHPYANELIEQSLNQRPRKILSFQTPEDVYMKEIEKLGVALQC